MRGYGQYCPIARTLDLLGDRWTMLIVRELLRGKRRFRDIEAGLPGIPPNLLSDRLKALEQAQIVTRAYFRELPPRVEYVLTERGQSLEPVLESLAGWGMEHLMDTELPCERVDPELLLFHLPRFFCAERAAGVAATLEVRLEGVDGRSWWVRVLDGTCLVLDAAPAERPAAVISCETQTFVDLLASHKDPSRLLAAPGVQVAGDADVAHRVVSLFCREAVGAVSGGALT